MGAADYRKQSVASGRKAAGQPSSIARGDLSGENSFGDTLFTDRNWQIPDVLREVSTEIERPLAQVALAWARAQNGVSSLIMGATKIEQLHDNLASLAIELTAEQLKKLGRRARPRRRFRIRFFRTKSGAASSQAPTCAQNAQIITSDRMPRAQRRAADSACPAQTRGVTRAVDERIADKANANIGFVHVLILLLPVGARLGHRVVEAGEKLLVLLRAVLAQSGEALRVNALYQDFGRVGSRLD